MPKFKLKGGEVLDIELGSQCIAEGYDAVATVRFIGKIMHDSKLKGKVRIGIEFAAPIGLNNGTVGGHEYFKCGPKHGAFVAVTKLTLAPNQETTRKINPVFDDSAEAEDEAETSVRVMPMTAIDGFGLDAIGSRVRIDTKKLLGVFGVIRFLGVDHKAGKQRVGVELDTADGINDGSAEGGAVRYFTCAPKYGVLTMPKAVTLVEDTTTATPKSAAVAASAAPIAAAAAPASAGSSAEAKVRVMPMSAIDGFGLDSIGARVRIDTKKLVGVFGVIRFLGVDHKGAKQRVGVELDNPEGINDGSVDDGAVRYFTCAPKYGIVTVPKYVTLEDTSAATPKSTAVAASAPAAAPASTGTSAVTEVRVLPMSAIDGFSLDTIGARVQIDTKKLSGVFGVIRFLGIDHKGEKQRVGVELDTADGINDGSVDGGAVRYFTCAPKYGIVTMPKYVTLVVEAASAPAGETNVASDSVENEATAELQESKQGQDPADPIEAAAAPAPSEPEPEPEADPIETEKTPEPEPEPEADPDVTEAEKTPEPEPVADFIETETKPEPEPTPTVDPVEVEKEPEPTAAAPEPVVADGTPNGNVFTAQQDKVLPFAPAPAAATKNVDAEALGTAAAKPSTPGKPWAEVLRERKETKRLAEEAAAVAEEEAQLQKKRESKIYRLQEKVAKESLDEGNGFGFDISDKRPAKKWSQEKPVVSAHGRGAEEFDGFGDDAAAVESSGPSEEEKRAEAARQADREEAALLARNAASMDEESFTEWKKERAAAKKLEIAVVAALQIEEERVAKRARATAAVAKKAEKLLAARQMHLQT